MRPAHDNYGPHTGNAVTDTVTRMEFQRKRNLYLCLASVKYIVKRPLMSACSCTIGLLSLSSRIWHLSSFPVLLAASLRIESMFECFDIHDVSVVCLLRVIFHGDSCWRSSDLRPPSVWAVRRALSGGPRWTDCARVARSYIIVLFRSSLTSPI